MFRIIVKKAIYILLHILYIFPVSKKKIIFESFEGKQMSCNPLYIYKTLKENNKEYKFIWVLNSPSSKTDNSIKSVRHNSIAYVYQMMTSKVIILNDVLRGYIPFRKNQFIINTWHGGGAYKKNLNISENQKKLKKKESEKYSYFLSSSKRFSEIVETDFFIDKGKVLQIGMPRNDIFFDKDKMLVAKNKVAAYYDLSSDLIVVLYAPTFRNTPENPIVNISLNFDFLSQSLFERFKKQPIILFRGHHTFSYFDKNRFINGANVINVSDYPDMQELICFADILITDYSSCMWDFALTGKPILIFAEDLDKYDTNRGFYIHPTQWGFPIAATNKELCKQIENINISDSYTCDMKHISSLDSFENGSATKVLVETINRMFKTEDKK